MLTTAFPLVMGIWPFYPLSDQCVIFLGCKPTLAVSEKHLVVEPSLFCSRIMTPQVRQLQGPATFCTQAPYAQARLKKLGMILGCSSWELRITALPTSSQPAWSLPSASKAGSQLQFAPSWHISHNESHLTALALPHMATDINPNPLLGNISIFWVFLQPLASIIGPTTYLSSYSAASQQQLLEQTILKYLFSSEGGLDWVHHPWHKPTAVLQISSGCFLPPNCVGTGFCGVALHSRTGKWNRIEKNLFFLAIATKNWMNANKGVHNGMGMSGCVWKVEMLYTCSAAEVSLEAKNKKVHPKFKLIT